MPKRVRVGSKIEKKNPMIQMDEWLKINLEAKQLSYKTLKDDVFWTFGTTVDLQFCLWCII